MSGYKTAILAGGTFFYIGYLPFIPGTFGSMAGLGLAYLTRESWLNFTLLASLITVLGFLVAGRAEGILKEKDPRCIVIDEVSGMLLSLICLPFDIKVILSAFLIFRLLDSLKPYPAGSFQNLKGSKGIMLDDIVAAFYTNIILQIALRWASFKAS